MSTQLLKNWAHQKIARAAMGVEKYCLATLVFVAIASIIGSSYLGTNGSHIFRQADVYGHILGFMGNRGFDSIWRGEN